MLRRYPIASYRRENDEAPWAETQEVGLAARGLGPIPRHTCTRHMFKTKTAHHSGARDEAAAQMKPSVAKDAAAFAELLLTDARCEQGIVESAAAENGDRIGFVEWCLADVRKEGGVLLLPKGSITFLAWLFPSRVCPVVV